MNWEMMSGWGMQASLERLMIRNPDGDFTRPIATPSCPGANMFLQSTSNLFDEHNRILIIFIWVNLPELCSENNQPANEFITL
jgi:hypothetical protein